jgi:hypothetical protein
MSRTPTHEAPPAGPVHRPYTGRIVLGLLLVLVGLGWLLDSLGAVDVRWAMILPAVLVIIGVALLSTAHRGGSGGLIAAGIVVSILVLVTSLLSVPFTGRLSGIGDVDERPVAVEDVEPGFGLGIGSMTIDLREVPLPDEPTTVEAGVGIGELVVRVPDGATVEVHARAGAGEVVVDREARSGVGVDLRDRIEGSDPEVVLRLEVSVGLGKVEVRR